MEETIPLLKAFNDEHEINLIDLIVIEPLIGKKNKYDFLREYDDFIQQVSRWRWV